MRRLPIVAHSAKSLAFVPFGRRATTASRTAARNGSFDNVDERSSYRNPPASKLRSVRRPFADARSRPDPLCEIQLSLTNRSSEQDVPAQDGSTPAVLV